MRQMIVLGRVLKESLPIYYCNLKHRIIIIFQIGGRDKKLFIKPYEEQNAFKGSLSGLKQFLTAESPLKMMKNTFYLMIKALFVLKIFTFLS